MSSAASREGILIVLSAPSGAGKLTILNALRAQAQDIVTTVSATTRAPRSGEVDGKDYYFVTREEFERRRDANEFLEWAVVHGNMYGTLSSELDRCLASGSDVVLELDVQGMRNLRRLGRGAISIFLMPPSLEALEQRLRGRAEDSGDEITVRLKNAVDEMEARDEFDHVVINDEIDRAVSEMIEILQSARKSANQ
jgi:guanylate kinase